MLTTSRSSVDRGPGCEKLSLVITDVVVVVDAVDAVVVASDVVVDAVDVVDFVAVVVDVVAETIHLEQTINSQNKFES